MAKKPANLIYGVDEAPPLGATLLLGFQHIFVLTISFVLILVLVREGGGSAEDAERLIKVSMISMGVATILQGLRLGPVGSGYLCPQLIGPAYLSASLLAVKSGGLSMVAGMTMVGGFFGALLSRAMRWLRPIFPAEVTGTVVAMVALELVPLSVSKFLGFEGPNPSIQSSSVVVASVTLASMVALSVWGQAKLRLYCVLIGTGIGYASSYFAGILTAEHLRRVVQAPFFSMPTLTHQGWSFDGALLVPFVVAAVASSLKAVGDLTTCQKINDAEWKRPDMRSIGGGILADACGVILSGGLGTMGQSTSSSNVGLSIGTGAASRRIAFACGGIMIFLAFFPKLAEFYVIMPTPVMGALLFFSVSFMILAGIQIMLSRLIDARKTFVIGISLILGLSLDMLPGAYREVYPALQPIFSSSLSLATVSAIVLNLLLRMGIAKRAVFEFEPGVSSSEEVFNFMERQGAVWGARREVIYNATAALNELLESLSMPQFAQGKVQIAVGFDEFNLDIDISYSGEPMEFPGARPSRAELLADDQGMAKLAGFLVQQYADRVRSDIANGRCRIQLHFDH
ncbi:MAG TPA: solute carrier family 23 protein [Candidatus Acidoferrales bacterium]|nr:solute carrier family 23 protein [Candidatus Acidoferrales bacterium]